MGLDFVREYGTTFPTVDIIPIDHATNLILMGRKPTDNPGEWRFIGGFVDTTDKCWEDAAARELKEEAGITMLPEDLFYFGSTNIDDSRLKGTKDMITTSVFIAPVQDDTAIAGDDIAEVAWVDPKTVNVAQVHKGIMEMLLKNWYTPS